MIRILLPLAALSLLTGCGLQPLYAGGSNGTMARNLSAIAVSPIEGEAGWLVSNALEDQIGATGASSPRYRLDVRLDDQLEALGVLSDDTVSRERRILRARYQLIDTVNNAILLDATARSDAGIDVVSSEYATIAAEQTALENLATDIAQRILLQVSLTLRDQP